jgi:hypothetical protein
MSYYLSGIDAIVRGEYSDTYLVISVPSLYVNNGSASVDLSFQIFGWVLY